MTGSPASAMAAVPFEVEVIPRAIRFSTGRIFRPGRRFLNRLAWQARRVQGKCLSVLRLGKALFTFKGGLDYILWKIERHSGVAIPEDSALRRYPLSGVWVIFWRLYRRGGFR